MNSIAPDHGGLGRRCGTPIGVLLLLTGLAGLAGCAAGEGIDFLKASLCGDSVVDAGEECDDGNGFDGDGCQSDCRNPVCGDGVVDPGEFCDDGNALSGDVCPADCMNAVCGDGTLDRNEECDDGNTTDGDGCASDCLVAWSRTD
jgi:cysteine-rich repeat protein